jgi:hypothetical protein
MRALSIVSLTIMVLASACTESDDTNCSQTSGCVTPDGGTPDSNNTGANCGDGVCDPDDGETADSCEKDCSGRCDPESETPVFCWRDGNPSCNPVWTDCNLPFVYGCGSGPRRCPDYESFGRCCDTADGMSSDIVWCPSEASCQQPVPLPRACLGPIFSCATGS